MSNQKPANDFEESTVTQEDGMEDLMYEEISEEATFIVNQEAPDEELNVTRGLEYDFLLLQDSMVILRYSYCFCSINFEVVCIF